MSILLSIGLIIAAFIGGYLFCANNPPASLKKKIKDKL